MRRKACMSRDSKSKRLTTHLQHGVLAARILGESLPANARICRLLSASDPLLRHRALQDLRRGCEAPSRKTSHFFHSFECPAGDLGRHFERSQILVAPCSAAGGPPRTSTGRSCAGFRRGPQAQIGTGFWPQPAASEQMALFNSCFRALAGDLP